MYGGRDSAKSYFAAQKVIIDTMRKPYSRFILIRKAYAHIKDSQFQTIKDIVESWGLSEYFQFNETPMRIIFKKNGNMILARGLDKDHKTKSLKDPTGVWYEEANEINFSDFLKTTTSLRGGIIQEIMTFNPEMETEWINSYFFPLKETYEKADGNYHYIKSIREDTTILHTTYKDNAYVTPQSAELLESFKDVDMNYYKIYTLGLWGGVLEGKIYEGWKIVEKVPKGFHLLAYGIDWGFANDPTAIIAVFGSQPTGGQGGKHIVISEVCYRKGMSNQDIVDVLLLEGVKPDESIVADSAEPKSIQELYGKGFNIEPSIKGPDSIKFGIAKVKEFEIGVTVGSMNLIRELKNYRWKMDKNGNNLNVPIDSYNHALDAVRYVVVNKIGVRKKRMTGVRSFRI